MKKKKQQKKKRAVRHSIRYNIDHSDFYTNLNLYHQLADFHVSGRLCYLSDGTPYRKHGGFKHEE